MERPNGFHPFALVKEYVSWDPLNAEQVKDLFSAMPSEDVPKLPATLYLTVVGQAAADQILHELARLGLEGPEYVCSRLSIYFEGQIASGPRCYGSQTVWRVNAINELLFSEEAYFFFCWCPCHPENNRRCLRETPRQNRNYRKEYRNRLMTHVSLHSSDTANYRHRSSVGAERHYNQLDIKHEKLKDIEELLDRAKRQVPGCDTNQVLQKALKFLADEMLRIRTHNTRNPLAVQPLRRQNVKLAKAVLQMDDSVSQHDAIKFWTPEEVPSQ